MEREVIMLAEDERIVIEYMNLGDLTWTAKRLRYCIDPVYPDGMWHVDGYGRGKSRQEALWRMDNVESNAFRMRAV